MYMCVEGAGSIACDKKRLNLYAKLTKNADYLQRKSYLCELKC